MEATGSGSRKPRRPAQKRRLGLQPATCRSVEADSHRCFESCHVHMRQKAHKAYGNSLKHRWNQFIRIGTCMPWTFWLVRTKLPIRVTKLFQELLLVRKYRL